MGWLGKSEGSSSTSLSWSPQHSGSAHFTGDMICRIFALFLYFFPSQSQRSWGRGILELPFVPPSVHPSVCCLNNWLPFKSHHDFGLVFSVAPSCCHTYDPTTTIFETWDTLELSIPFLIHRMINMIKATAGKKHRWVIASVCLSMPYAEGSVQMFIWIICYFFVAFPIYFP